MGAVEIALWRSAMRRIHAGLAVGLVLALASVGGAEDQPAAPHVHRSPVMQKCLDACLACANQCASCFVHCTNLVASGKKEHLATMKSCLDCGDLCVVAAKIISRDGALVVAACEGCAKACDACATECEKFPSDEHMAACAKACRDCAKACREMVKSSS
jgi:hypothetical protein